jgi:hypothetical protein
MKIDEHGNAVPGSSSGMSQGLASASYGVDPNY